MQENIPLLHLDQAGTLDLTVDGADEVDPNLDLIKGYGRALVREKVVAAASRRLVILVGEEKLVPRLGSRGKLPVEVIPFSLPLCERRLRQLGCQPVPFVNGGSLFVTDNGNHILDCRIEPITDAAKLECDIRAIPGVVGTGLFLGMAAIVLVGARNDFRMLEERQRGERSNEHARKADHEQVQQTA
jgi:ribose 5-phosphate isomerase A